MLEVIRWRSGGGKVQNSMELPLNVNVFGNVALNESEFPGFMKAAEIGEPARDEVINSYYHVAFGNEETG